MLLHQLGHLETNFEVLKLKMRWPVLQREQFELALFAIFLRFSLKFSVKVLQSVERMLRNKLPVVKVPFALGKCIALILRD